MYSITQQIEFIQAQQRNETEWAKSARAHGLPSADAYQQNADKFAAVLATLQGCRAEQPPTASLTVSVRSEVVQ